MCKVAVVIGSESDRNLGDEIVKLLEQFGIECEYLVISAHRCPDLLDEFVKESDADLFIAVAGLSAALPGYIASRTLKPVIGVPRNVALNGLDSLLSIAQMPPGIPVATVGIDNAKNAALLAVTILALKNSELYKKLKEYREELRKRSFKKLK